MDARDLVQFLLSPLIVGFVSGFLGAGLGVRRTKWSKEENL